MLERADEIKPLATRHDVSTEIRGGAVRAVLIRSRRDAVQIAGGSGVVVGSAVERLYRSIRALRIYEGATEIQHLIIGGALLQGPSS